MVVAEVSIFPLGTETTSVSDYVAAAVRELEASGLKCTLGPMGTMVEAENPEEIYAAWLGRKLPSSTSGPDGRTRSSRWTSGGMRKNAPRKT